MGKILDLLQGVAVPQLKKRELLALDAEFEKLQSEHASLKSEHNALRKKMEPLEKENRELKERLAHKPFPKLSCQRPKVRVF